MRERWRSSESEGWGFSEPDAWGPSAPERWKRSSPERWTIDSWAVTDGLLFATDGSVQAGRGRTVYLRAPYFRPVTVARRSIALSAARTGFQAGFYGPDGVPIAFRDLDEVVELCRRAYVAGGLGPDSGAGAGEPSGEGPPRWSPDSGLETFGREASAPGRSWLPEDESVMVADALGDLLHEDDTWSLMGHYASLTFDELVHRDFRWSLLDSDPDGRRFVDEFWRPGPDHFVTQRGRIYLPEPTRLMIDAFRSMEVRAIPGRYGTPLSLGAHSARLQVDTGIRRTNGTVAGILPALVGFLLAAWSRGDRRLASKDRRDHIGAMLDGSVFPSGKLPEEAEAELTRYIAAQVGLPDPGPAHGRVNA